VLAVVERKRKGEEISVEEPERKDEPDDLAAALEASLG
jgi:hypothetical protein